jgi:cellulose biosynthesis protein BcsQ
VPQDPYILAIGSHKGGTGRTTTALALACLWGRSGVRVTLADVDPVRAAGLVALADGVCPWPNVRYTISLPRPRDPGYDADLIVVDCPALLAPAARPVLQRATTIILTVLADPLSLRTVPAAAGVLESARADNPRLELLGVLVGRYNERDPLQPPILAQLRQMHGPLLLDTAIPDDPALRNWPLSPGVAPPDGPGAAAFETLANRLAARVRLSSSAAPAAGGGASRA